MRVLNYRYRLWNVHSTYIGTVGVDIFKFKLAQIIQSLTWHKSNTQNRKDEKEYIFFVPIWWYVLRRDGDGTLQRGIFLHDGTRCGWINGREMVIPSYRVHRKVLVAETRLQWAWYTKKISIYLKVSKHTKKFHQVIRLFARYIK